MAINRAYTRVVGSTLINFLLSLALFAIGRVIFLCVNLSLFTPISLSQALEILQGGLVFDLAAAAYINALYLVVMLIPLHLKEGAIYQRVAKWIYMLFNAVALASNLADSRYYPFTKRRSTASVFSEFSNDSTIYKVIVDEALSSWYLVVIFAALIYLLWRLCSTPRKNTERPNYWIYYPLHTLYFVVGLLLTVCAIRGGIGADVRPITISNANQYVSNPSHTALVLNTPFSFIRTQGKSAFTTRDYFSSQEELEAIFSPERYPSPERKAKAKNVVVVIMESFGREYIGALNRGTNRPSYTPFLDSLIGQSLTFTRSYANGQKSIDGMPSILSSIPMFVEPFFLTSSSLNRVSGIAGELGSEGYHTSFFHGAANGSMGFMAFARATGFEEYYGRENYNNDKDFDGRWAIWDEEFFGYYATCLSSFKQPFASAIFSASSHHPFKVPERYEGVFDKGTIPIHQCVGYSDNALRLFFKSIKNEPFFEDTLFVITADHTSLTAYPEAMNSVETFSVPIILYHPGSELRDEINTIAQQIDIMPTVLGYLGYSSPYIAFGRDLLASEPDDGFAVNYHNGLFQLIEGDYVLRHDGESAVALYDYSSDKMMEDNILGTSPEIESRLTRRIEAIIEQYMDRMVEDRLIMNCEL